MALPGFKIVNVQATVVTLYNMTLMQVCYFPSSVPHLFLRRHALAASVVGLPILVVCAQKMLALARGNPVSCMRTCCLHLSI